MGFSVNRWFDQWEFSTQDEAFCLKLGALVGLLLPFMMWFWMVSPQVLDLVKLDVMAGFSDPVIHKKWRVRDDQGMHTVVTVLTEDGQAWQLLTAAQVKQALISRSRPVEIFWQIPKISIFTAALGAVLAWLGLRKLRIRRQKNFRPIYPERLASPVIPPAPKRELAAPRSRAVTATPRPAAVVVTPAPPAKQAPVVPAPLPVKVAENAATPSGGTVTPVAATAATTTPAPPKKFSYLDEWFNE